MFTPVMQQKTTGSGYETVKFWYRSSNGLSFGACPTPQESSNKFWNFFCKFERTARINVPGRLCKVPGRIDVAISSRRSWSIRSTSGSGSILPQKLVRGQQRQIADLRQQREVLKKRWALSARYQRIEVMKADYRIEVLCAAFCVSRSGYYQWLDRKQTPSARRREDLAIAEQIGRIPSSSGGTYGTPRLHAELKAMGTPARSETHRSHSQATGSLRPDEVALPASDHRQRHEQPIAANRLATLREVMESIKYE